VLAHNTAIRFMLLPNSPARIGAQIGFLPYCQTIGHPWIG
jgi:hypothetical protein